MKTIRISAETYQSLLGEKRGNDSFDDVVMRLYCKAKLLEKLPPSMKDLLMTKEVEPCKT